MADLFKAIDDHNIVLVKNLLKEHHDLNIHNNLNETPLQVAIYRGYAYIVELLLSHGADPNTQTIDGYTSLHFASMAGYEGIVRLLLIYKANPNLQTINGFHHYGSLFLQVKQM